MTEQEKECKYCQSKELFVIPQEVCDGVILGIWKHNLRTFNLLICMECGKTLKTGYRQVHHIDPYVVSRSHELNNLLTICDKCHKKIHEGRIEGSYSYGHKHKYRKRSGRKIDSKKHHHSRARPYIRRKKHKGEYGECD